MWRRALQPAACADWRVRATMLAFFTQDGRRRPQHPRLIGEQRAEPHFVVFCEVPGQVVYVERLEEEALGQPSEIALQHFEDFEHLERVDSQLAERRKRVEVGTQRVRLL